MLVGKPLFVESLELELKEPGLLRLKGTISTPTALGELKRLLQEVHAGILSARLTRFTIDVRALTFVNSSTIRVFVDWVSWATQGGYKLAFATDPAITWHRLSFTVLKTLAPDSVELLDGSAAT